MNIFAVDKDPVVSARSLVDNHVIKTILETCQLLSTAHRVLDGNPYVDATGKRKVQRWDLPAPMDKLYKATHVNHPSAVWCRISINNYNWLYAHFLALLDEYTFRYGKVHKCSELVPLLSKAPLNINHGPLTSVTPAMPEEYLVVGDSVTSYRNYYRNAKKDLHKWTKRAIPDWI